MPGLRDKQFEAFVEVIESACAWSGGIDFKWEGDVVLSSEVLADLVRLAFEAPVSDRAEFVAALTEPA